MKVAVSYINARTLHLLRTRAINAPLPGTFVSGVPDSGVRPLGNNDNVFEYDSSGRFEQNQFIVNVTKNLKRNSSLIAYYVLAKANGAGVPVRASNPCRRRERAYQGLCTELDHAAHVSRTLAVSGVS